MVYRTRRTNKKGMLDMFYTLPIVIVFCFVLVFIGAKVINSWDAGYALTETNPSLVAASQANNANTIASLNYLPFVVIGGGIIVVLFIASLMPTNPVLFFIGIVFFIFASATAFMYANITDSSVPDSVFSVEKAQMSDAAHLPTKLPYIIIAGGILLLVVTYSRLRNGTGA